MGLLNICFGLVDAIQAPFFPGEATRKGCTASQFGAIFGIIHVGIFLTSPFVPRLVQRLGLLPVFMVGCLICSLAALLFGLLTYIEKPGPFLAAAYALRLLEGFGGSAVWCTMLAILLASYPSRPAVVYSLYDATFGLGFTIGPVFGAMLYELSGFVLPFAVCGGALLLTSVISFPIVRPLTKEAESQISSELPSPRPLLSSFVFVTALVVTSGAAITFGFIESLLELYLDKTFDLTVTQIGFCFLGYAIAYTLFTILAGVLTDSKVKPWSMNIFGLFTSVVAFYLLAPPPYFPFEPNLYTTVGSLMLQGIGSASILVSSYSCALNAALAMPQFGDDVSTYSLVSSLWTASYALGNFIGPTTAGLLYDQVGFQWGCVAMQGLMVVMLIASLVSSCKVKVVEEEVEEKVEEKEMGVKDGIEATTVKVSDVDIETKM